MSSNPQPKQCGAVAGSMVVGAQADREGCSRMQSSIKFFANEGPAVDP
jgi:hypothetical protein